MHPTEDQRHDDTSFHEEAPRLKKRKVHSQLPVVNDRNHEPLIPNNENESLERGTDVFTKDDSSGGPACCSCRRKKARCSRTQPCSQCVRLDIQCTYNEAKMKPGMRTGAIENLTQRVATLENMFLGQSVIWQQLWRSMNSGIPADPGYSSSSQGAATSMPGLIDSLKETLTGLSGSETNSSQKDPMLQTRTSTLDDVFSTQRSRTLGGSEMYAFDGVLEPLPDNLIDSLVEVYFEKIHPWIPMLHVCQFRLMLSDPIKRTRLANILHAIVSVCIRFSNDPQLDMSPNLRAKYASQSRQRVILASMDSFSVENLQALIICAFDTLGSGRGPSAWSIVGSMARTVEQLRLSIEDDEDGRSASAHSLIRRMAFLAPSSSWREAEERRRVFWNVFLMDRFCSIATGWNLSLTTADVKRRLPCEGALWGKGEPLEIPTPYFGVSDQSYGSPNCKIPSGRPEEEEQTSLGGFAYCIEATESLSLVTSFFLQHEVNVSNTHDLQRWIIQFKQLDLRLVQWKVFLPEKWREACVLNSDGNMDPNLTLAHITQNTAVVLLHQAVAYPVPEWQNIAARLPSSSSAETCQAAANEVAIIAENFLQNCSILTNPQFAFCLFVCGQVLISHAAYYHVALLPAFDTLVASLREISSRWNGNNASSVANLASRFASRLVQARREGSAQADDIRESAFAEQPKKKGNTPMETRSRDNAGQQYPASSFPWLNQGETDANLFLNPFCRPDDSPDSISLAFPPLPLALQTSTSQGALAEVITTGPPEFSVSQNETPISFNFSLDNYDLLDQRVSMFSHSNAPDDSERVDSHLTVDI